jgi:hypothetical protein
MGTFSIVNFASVVCSSRSPGGGSVGFVSDDPPLFIYGDGSNTQLIYSAFHGSIVYIDHLSSVGSGVVTNSNITFILDLGTALFSLDGGLPISFFDLPPGFTILSGNISVSLTYAVGNAILVFNGISDTHQGSGILHITFNKIPTLTFVTETISISVYASTAFGGSSLSNIYAFDGIFIDGTYGISSFSIIQEDPQTPVKVGDVIKFSIDTTTVGTIAGVGTQTQAQIEAAAQDIVNQIFQIQLSFVDPITGLTEIIIIDEDTNPYSIIFRTWNRFWFTLPIGFGRFSGPVTISFIGDGTGTQFSGTIPVGIIQVLFEDASGIYVLDKNKTNDTLYFRSSFINTNSLTLSDIISYQDEFIEDDFFSLLNYPKKILSRSALDEDYQTESDFTPVSISESFINSITTVDTEIPSPFIKTAFLP